MCGWQCCSLHGECTPARCAANTQSRGFGDGWGLEGVVVGAEAGPPAIPRGDHLVHVGMAGARRQPPWKAWVGRRGLWGGQGSGAAQRRGVRGQKNSNAKLSAPGINWQPWRSVGAAQLAQHGCSRGKFHSAATGSGRRLSMWAAKAGNRGVGAAVAAGAAGGTKGEKRVDA